MVAAKAARVRTQHVTRLTARMRSFGVAPPMPALDLIEKLIFVGPWSWLSIMAALSFLEGRQLNAQLAACRVTRE
jgi:hypothetical protein